MKSNKAFSRGWAWMAIAVCGAAHSQFGPARPPSRATDLSPPAGIQATTATSTFPFTAQWSQYLTPGGLTLNPIATHFYVCLDAFTGSSPPPACSLANADWVESIAAPTPALTRVGNRITFNPGRVLTLADFNKPQRFTVGSCTALMQSACTSTNVDTAWSSVNLVANGTGVKNTGNPAIWTLDVRATNPGSWTSPAPAITAVVEYWEVLGVGAPGRDCFRDVDDPSVRNDNSLVAFDVDGKQTLVPSLPRVNGFYSGPPIQGIYRFGSAYDARAVTTGNPSINADITTARAIADVSFPVADAGLTRTFVVASRLDSNGVVPETNENDNLRAQCKRR